jgi:hypothetical protein
MESREIIWMAAELSWIRTPRMHRHFSGGIYEMTSCKKSVGFWNGLGTKWREFSIVISPTVAN